MPDKLYALTIVAHPDDESFVFAGTTLKFEEEGKTVAVVCGTRGEKGADRLDRKLTFPEMAKIRTQELLQACSILHCDCKKIMDHSDGELDQVDFDQLVNEITDEINSYRPEIVLTFGAEGISGHRDHITIGRAALAASKKSNPRPSEVWLASVPASAIENFEAYMEQRKIHHLHFIKKHLKGVADDQLTKIDVTKYRDTKIKAVQAHASQSTPQLIWPSFLENEWFEVVKLS